MEPHLDPPTTATTTQSPPSLDNDYDIFINDSNCSTPFVSAPSSPNRSSTAALAFYYSAPASPIHSSLSHAASDASSAASFEFEFSSRFDSPAAPDVASMSSADELFLNGQIRPMKLSAHLLRPQPPLPPLIDDDNDAVFERSSRFRDRSQRRRTRSLSPLRNSSPFDWLSDDTAAASTPIREVEKEIEKESETTTTTAAGSASSSRCSSAGRSSKRWVFLRDFLRSKSEGRSNNKFWHNISFSPAKEKKLKEESNGGTAAEKSRTKAKEAKKSPAAKIKSAHEMHYTANRAQAEEMRKKTYLPYRQGLLGCLGFNSKSYGALNGFARALNPVSSS